MSDDAAWTQDRARTPGGWTHEAMRDAVRDARRAQRELEEIGETEGGPTEVVLAGMLEQLLDEIALGQIEHEEER